jgi:histidyl-tRNA synthetase
MRHQALPGFRDFHPPELAVRAHVFGAMRRVALRYGFEEYDGPPLEALELYTEKSGDEIVAQLYHFEDKGGRAVALRPEMTPTLARMVAPKANGLRKPIRWFSLPQLFRYERQQRGRLREHFQLNCDLIGEPGPLGDAEIIALALDVMRELGLGPDDVRVRVSDRRLLTALLAARGVPAEGLPAAFEFIDKVERMRPDEAGAFEAAAGARLGPAGVAGVREIAGVRGREALAAALADAPDAREAAGPLLAVADALDAMGLGPFVDIDLTIVRGLAYYTGTVFELFDAGYRADVRARHPDRTPLLRAVCGGGRYDGLLGALGGVDLPALGFGMGDVVLTELLRDRGLLPAPPASVDVFVAVVSPAERPAALGLTHRLRDAGFRVEYALADQALGKQLRLADARGARAAVVLGPDDLARGEAVVKDLAAGTQRAVPEGAVTEALRELLAARRSP